MQIRPLSHNKIRIFISFEIFPSPNFWAMQFLHVALFLWVATFYNFFSFRATEGLFISKWGRISAESDWCWFKFIFTTPTDLSLAVGHVSECPSSGTRYYTEFVLNIYFYLKQCVWQFCLENVNYCLSAPV